MPELADVVRLHGQRYVDKFGPDMLPSHRRALEDILACRTPALGGHVFECDRCKHVQYACHSCKNRSCPKCHTSDTQQWIEKRRRELLPADYFHVVFTIPHDLHPIARSNQIIFYSTFMNCAAAAIIKLCADPRYLAGTTGVMAVLHTWTRTLAYHPHVHCLVPAAAVAGGHWIGPPKHNFLVPVRALSKLMRGLMLDQLQRALPQIQIPRNAWRVKWVVHIKPAVAGTQNVLDYLARYVHRIAIANCRIVSVSQSSVTFRYQDSSTYKWKIITLTPEEFLRRYLQHVLPRGFHKVRYYGLWAPANRRLLRKLQLVMPMRQTCDDKQHHHQTCHCENKCPRCFQGTMRLIGPLRPIPHITHTRAPP